MRPRWIFLTAFALVFYGTGAAFIEGFVNYASWHLIGADEFIAYHQFISPRVLGFLVAPLLLGTAFTVLLLWSRPAAIPAWAVWAAIAAAQAVVWVSTVTIQVPIQLQLSAHGQSVESWVHVMRGVVANKGMNLAKPKTRLHKPDPDRRDQAHYQSYDVGRRCPS